MKKRSYKRMVLVLSVIFIIFVFVLALLIIKKKEDDVKSEEVNSLSSVEQQIQEEEAYKIETKYSNLYYPVKWKENLSVKISDEEKYSIVFYGKTDEKNEYKLFTITFEGKEGYKIGTFKSKDKEMDIYLISFELPEDLCEEDKDILTGMQEDVNFLLGMLEKEKEFEAVK